MRGSTPRRRSGRAGRPGRSGRLAACSGSLRTAAAAAGRSRPPPPKSSACRTAPTKHVSAKLQRVT
eukprot:6180588-Pleurochrysis_carterae.AAC.1